MSINLKRELLRGAEVCLPPEKLDRLRQLTFGHDDVPYEGAGRRMNRFMLGADPEFVFANGVGPVQAAELGLKPGLAFGADQNDRLVELRAHPSRSAVGVLASVLSELRWMYRSVPSTRDLMWVSGAFQFRDGLGGHVHFGRKRQSLREHEVRGLDGLARTMRATGFLFPNKEWDRRAKGDAHGQMYGLYGDIRAQKHGYEYRTLPSWLDSPRLALLVLTLSKLVILDPEITQDWDPKKGEAWDMLRGLAKFYRGRDDDAWLLFTMMGDAKLFAWAGGDFRPRWGLVGNSTVEEIVVPPSIKPCVEDCDDLMQLFLNGQAISMRETEPTFRHEIPNGYKWIIRGVDAGRRPGVGDLIPDFVTGDGDRPAVSFHFDADNYTLQIQTPADYDHIKLRKQFAAVPNPYRVRVDRSPLAVRNFSVHVGREWRKGWALHFLKGVLLGGSLPLWTVDGVQASSIEEWKARDTVVNARFDLAALLT
jgi:phiEco32-like amidoligase-type 2 protein